MGKQTRDPVAFVFAIIAFSYLVFEMILVKVVCPSALVFLLINV